MRIIHCADLHLDSRLTTHLDQQKARQRKAELLHNFSRLIVYAQKNQVAAIVIAGDLFDTPIISATARNLVLAEIKNHPQIKFYYLPGNHETDGFLETLDEMPDNLLTFGPVWQSYLLNPADDWPIRISGLNLNDPQFKGPLSAPQLDPTNFNLVVLHGQITAYQDGGSPEKIALNLLENQGIDYLALGHLHQYQSGVLPAAGQYCYAGCLEGRGFDELGDHGFVLLEIDEKNHQWQKKFISFAQRRLFEVKVDVSGCQTTLEVEKQIKNQLSKSACQPQDLVKIILTGKVHADSERNLVQLEQDLAAKFYYLKISDQTEIAIDYHQYAADISLKGEFIRLLEQDQALTDKQKGEVIRCGLQALKGEELDQ